MISQHTLIVPTQGRGMINVTALIEEFVKQSAMTTGLCNIFIHHTSASIILCENADFSVQQDLEAFMNRLVPDGDALFEHIAEGPDDMPSHIRNVLTQSSLTIPVSDQKLSLGVWQGIYLWEHRFEKHQRKLTVTIQGI